jgi:hypothetical protein
MRVCHLRRGSHQQLRPDGSNLLAAAAEATAEVERAGGSFKCLQALRSGSAAAAAAAAAAEAAARQQLHQLRQQQVAAHELVLTATDDSEVFAPAASGAVGGAVDAAVDVAGGGAGGAAAGKEGDEAGCGALAGRGALAHAGGSCASLASGLRTPHCSLYSECDGDGADEEEATHGGGVSDGGMAAAAAKAAAAALATQLSLAATRADSIASNSSSLGGVDGSSSSQPCSPEASVLLAFDAPPRQGSDTAGGKAGKLVVARPAAQQAADVVASR